MSDAVVAALITGGLALVGVVLTVRAGNNKLQRELQHELDVSLAVLKTQQEELTREVRLHNGFAQKIPVLEEKVAVANHRITDLERQAGK